jgi:hypothetical protein
MHFGELHKNCTTGFVFESYYIMTGNKINSTVNESVYPHRTWSLRVFNYSFSHDSYIVPWQIDDNKQYPGNSDKADLRNK